MNTKQRLDIFLSPLIMLAFAAGLAVSVLTLTNTQYQTYSQSRVHFGEEKTLRDVEAEQGVSASMGGMLEKEREDHNLLFQRTDQR